jgi:membrane associated rhomboid family serine protease
VDRFLATLERKYGKFAIEHLTQFIVGGMAIVFVLSRIKPEFEGMLVLDLDMVRHGQVWRLVTYLFLPTSKSIFWILFSLWWVWMIGTNLENEWGALKFNLFYLLGMGGTTAAAWLSGGAVGNSWLNMSLFFAFTTMFPDYQIFPIPFIPFSIKVKWLGLLSALFVVYSAVVGDWVDRAAIVAALSNYFLFFGGHLLGMLRSRNVVVRQTARRGESLPVAEKPTGGRSCAICGKAEDDDADIRKCTCDKCKPYRNLCLEHARNH